MKMCINPKCREVLRFDGWALCPSCHYIGRWCFWIGAVLAGFAVELVRLLR